jgi:hypothetical protein
VPFIIRQQLQPAFIMAVMQSQQAWIISAHLASPLVQVMVQPSLVMSHLHMAMVMLQQQTNMPFMTAQQLTMPPAIMVHRFCIMLHAVGSVQVQAIFMPPWTFSIFMVQRGIIMVPGIIGMPWPIAVPPIRPVPGIMPPPGIMAVLIMPPPIIIGFAMAVSLPRK